MLSYKRESGDKQPGMDLIGKLGLWSMRWCCEQAPIENLPC